MGEFHLHAPFAPTGDQPEAIAKLVEGFREGNQFETLLGVTGSGKTFTMANIIQALQRPTLIISHNKTLAAQLYGEFKEFFPENAVEYFVSYYDYYQPEAYVPSSDTYIEKDADVNLEIDRLRHSATAALTERRDVIVVASVSCIYGLGSPIDYQLRNNLIELIAQAFAQGAVVGRGPNTAAHGVQVLVGKLVPLFFGQRQQLLGGLARLGALHDAFGHVLDIHGIRLSLGNDIVF